MDFEPTKWFGKYFEDQDGVACPNCWIVETFINWKCSNCWYDQEYNTIENKKEPEKEVVKEQVSSIITSNACWECWRPSWKYLLCNSCYWKSKLSWES